MGAVSGRRRHSKGAREGKVGGAQAVNAEQDGQARMIEAP